MEDDFTVEGLKRQLAAMQEAEKKHNLAKLVPSIFVTVGDRIDTFALEANGKWTGDKYPREILPAVRAYKTALLKELRQAEWYIQYLQSDGLFPLGEITIKANYKERDDSDI